ncbi:MAG: DegV family protein [Clostridiales bacterium]|nr:DegV family protein [Clostridiales bacterium]
MKKYVIVSDSCCDLSKELREKYDIDYIPMHFSYEGKDYAADIDWKELSFKDFYAEMRAGKRMITSQVNAPQYREVFEKYIADGYDILSISCSSALSNSVKASYMVRDELLQKYPESKIVCVDSLSSCYGLGLICIRAAELRAEGKTIEETAAWLEENKLTVNQECTPESLTYLKKAGRVSAMSAFFGGLLSVKPILISDVNGQNAAVEKVKGRMTSIKRLAERVKEEYVRVPHQRIVVVHADCENDANTLKNLVAEALAGEDVTIDMGYIGPIIGASAGPGTLAVYFYGKEVTFNSKAN